MHAHPGACIRLCADRARVSLRSLAWQCVDGAATQQRVPPRKWERAIYRMVSGTRAAMEEHATEELSFLTDLLASPGRDLQVTGPAHGSTTGCMQLSEHGLQAGIMHTAPGAGEPSTSEASPSEQLRLLHQQLLHQQQLLMALQQQHTTQTAQAPVSAPTASSAPLPASNAARPCTTILDRSAARRANRARQRAQQLELEGRLQHVAALHVQLLQENAVLQRRANLLQSGVAMREQHLHTLIKSRQNSKPLQEAQNQQQHGASSGAAFASAVSEEATRPDCRATEDGTQPSSATTPPTAPSQSSEHVAAAQGQTGSLPEQNSIERFASFSAFPDPGMWDAAMCTMIRCVGEE